MRNKQTLILLISIGLALFTFRVCRADGLALEEAAGEEPANLCKLAKKVQDIKPAEGEEESDYYKRALEIKRKCEEALLPGDGGASQGGAEGENSTMISQFKSFDAAFITAFRDFAQSIRDELGCSDETFASIDAMIAQGPGAFDLLYVIGMVEHSMDVCEGAAADGAPLEGVLRQACEEDFPLIIYAYNELLENHEFFDPKEAQPAAFDPAEFKKKLNESASEKAWQDIQRSSPYRSELTRVCTPGQRKTSYMSVPSCRTIQVGNDWQMVCNGSSQIPYETYSVEQCEYKYIENRMPSYRPEQRDIFKFDDIYRKTDEERSAKNIGLIKPKMMPMLATSRVRLGKYLERSGGFELASVNYTHEAKMFERYQALIPEQAARVYVKIADGFEKAGNAEEAEKNLDKADDAAMANPPNDASFCAETFLLIGKYALGKGENLKAKNRFESAEAAVCKGLVNTTIDNCAASPLTAEIFDNLAAAYELLGNSEDAAAAKVNADEMRRLLSGGDEPQTGEQGGGDSGRQMQ